ncbi:SPOR domain-containing protein [Variovorax sp. PAMC 28711]|uniref:SPOR domain-containing protein n=1 Tax=Variovorax sp. PAMC 28711 TaxID=1795631 RepID=UPI00078D47E7|nr:SPOR domain-containing protein [Variovorax sp. PAMC 28711]AMM23585.1 sporulation protein [Variovorax sp. PAMC 28711]
MAFFKFRKGGAPGNEGRNASVAAAPAESVETMRRRARHRLLGAVVLVLVGVIGFPLLFDTQPRPIAVDIPIEIPDRNKAKPIVVPAAPTPAPVAAANPDAGSSRVASGATAGSMITEAADGSEIPAAKPAPVVKSENKPEPKPETKPKPEPKSEAKAESKPEAKPKPEVKPEAKPEPKPAAKPADDGARAKALLDGKFADASAAKPAASDDAGRFAIQVGAFADAAKAREVRQKLEKAGLKTYTTVAKTADGERTRVRVGPFASRGDADKAAAKVKGLSLSAAVLPL